MSDSVFVELRFWLMVGVSSLAPLIIYAVFHRRRSVTSLAIVGLGACLLVISGIDVALLRSLEILARSSRSLNDDALFASEVSIALYVLPILFGGIGVNLISHVLMAHLTQLGQRFDREPIDPQVTAGDAPGCVADAADTTQSAGGALGVETSHQRMRRHEHPATAHPADNLLTGEGRSVLTPKTIQGRVRWTWLQIR